MKKGFTIEKKNFHNISLGQGQEKVAEDAIELSSQLGHWVMLQVRTHNTRYIPYMGEMGILLYSPVYIKIYVYLIISF